jgi:hypothetical protein
MIIMLHFHHRDAFYNNLFLAFLISHLYSLLIKPDQTLKAPSKGSPSTHLQLLVRAGGAAHNICDANMQVFLSSAYLTIKLCKNCTGGQTGGR